jgi:hypothetical protein
MIDLTGKRFGRLAVISFGGISHRSASRPHGKPTWACVCDCGTDVTILGASLLSGITTSCGCFRIEQITKHGFSRSKEYQAWSHAIQRCYNQNDPHYDDYGGRGIYVCDRWKSSFENFLADMGFAPSKSHSIDRIDNDKGYTPDNCRWALPTTQLSNRRSNIFIEFDGLRLHIAEWARRRNIPVSTIYTRLQRGCTPEEALFVIRRRRKKA